MSAPATGSSSEIPLGHSPLADRLIARIEDRLRDGADSTAPHRAVEQSLVIGVFGEWGAGKSTLLKRVHAHFRALAFPAELAALPQDAVTIPIEFNPWRYERETELIVPLLHTTEQVVALAAAQYQSRPASGGTWFGLFARFRTPPPAGSGMLKALENVGRFCLVAGMSLASAVTFKVKVPALGEVEVAPKDAIAEAKSLLDTPLVSASRDDTKRKALLNEMSSLYYDFQRRLSEITGRVESGGAHASRARINLLYLIDDLDRCLPEKAVEMLETIKLFLDVPGCAFIVAIDDEVVERGILHRYRDYLFAQGTGVDMTRPPITGTEYLEKIIHLPLRLPLPTEQELRTLLLSRYRELFSPAVDRPGVDKSSEPIPTGADTAQRRAGGAASPGTARAQEAEQLLDLFIAAVPPVPRKLIRAVDLFLLCGDIARARGWTGFSTLVLARIVMLQLFAPETYRYGRRQPALLAVLDAYSREHANEWDLASFDKPEDYKERERRVYELTDVPVIRLLKLQAANRNGFRTQRLFSTRWPIPEADLKGIGRYFSLLEEAGAASSDEGPTEEIRPIARIDAPADFVALLVSERPDAWRSALEPIVGQQIPDEVLALIVSRVTSLANERGTWPPMLGMSWLEQLVRHLSAGQVRRFYRDTMLLYWLAKEPGS